MRGIYLLVAYWHYVNRIGGDPVSHLGSLGQLIGVLCRTSKF